MPQHAQGCVLWEQGPSTQHRDACAVLRHGQLLFPARLQWLRVRNPAPCPASPRCACGRVPVTVVRLTMFVASMRPPMPTSRMTTSGRAWMKICRPAGKPHGQTSIKKRHCRLLLSFLAQHTQLVRRQCRCHSVFTTCWRAGSAAVSQCSQHVHNMKINCCAGSAAAMQDCWHQEGSRAEGEQTCDRPQTPRVELLFV